MFYWFFKFVLIGNSFRQFKHLIILKPQSDEPCPTCRKLLSFMFSGVDGAATPKTKPHSGSSSALSKKPTYRRDDAEDEDEDDDQPDLKDILNAIKVIQTIQRLLAENHLMLKPMMLQHGFVKKGLIPIEASRRFTSRVGKRASQDKADLDDEDDEENDDGDETDEDKDEVIKSHARSKREDPKSKKLSEKVSCYF